MAFAITVAILLLSACVANLVYALCNEVVYVFTPRHIILLGSMVAADVFMYFVAKGFEWETWCGWLFGVVMGLFTAIAIFYAYSARNEAEDTFNYAEAWNSVAGASLAIAVNFAALCATGFVAAYA